MTARWGAIAAGEIVSALRGELISGSPARTFAGISTDSREINPGDLFWALKGERYDGHDFAGKAAENGAAGFVIRRDFRPEYPQDRKIVMIGVPDTLKALGDLAGWWRGQHRIPVVAITGSAGKTTTKEMAAGILELSGETLKNRGNLNNLIGLPLTLLMLEERHRTAVLEMGMNQPGEIARLTEIADPDIGLITNVAKAHLEGVGSLMGVAKAKVELLERISSKGQVILNGDDDVLMEVASPFQRKIMTFGLGPKNDLKAHSIRNHGREGLSFELRYGEEAVSVRLKVPGTQNVFNALAASAVAFCLNKSPEHLVEGLYRFPGIRGRFMISALPGGASLVDDTYNANPFSLRVAMDSLKDLAANGGRVIVGLGEMLELGDETVPAHLEAGGMVAELGAHYFVAMGEHAQEMINGAVGKGFPPERAVAARTLEEMAQKLGDVIKRDDLVFLKGSRQSGLEKVADLLKGKAVSNL
ncbi:MAG: UDP-N-acetylmuramoyl-tripeptide--D-alanyl-D-alanine ligase [Desulfobacteraceae bacterium]|jgi:UDP-N-acetylmuramoyl-tripeptide--D-alanyl-D-alanine ligase